MKRRKLTATFQDGTTITRTTVNSDLCYAWQVIVDVPWKRDYATGKVNHGEHSQFKKTGFSSSQLQADKAMDGCAFKREGQTIIHREIVKVTTR